AGVQAKPTDAARVPRAVAIAAIERGLQALVVDGRAAHPGPVVEAHVGCEVAGGEAEEVVIGERIVGAAIDTHLGLVIAGSVRVPVIVVPRAVVASRDLRLAQTAAALDLRSAG